MDSRTQLDRALFQLTPTRTRCDLLVVSKSGTKEKIASGLVDPFLKHLKSASEQISKGGYSFDLFPTANGVGGNGDLGWFTKGTVERFVRFVATPEILERVVTIEKEIVQIEDEICRTQQAVASNPEASGENSKYSLLVVLENRQKMLKKEQGMAYARASIVGYDKGHIDDLVAFADSFGALRLREACISFKELCAEKEKDKLWADELAALAAYGHSQLSSTQNSGITLTAENERNVSPGQEQSGVSPDTQGMNSIQWNQGQQQVPPGWFNHHPEYMYPFHGPMPANSAPFQGYAYPGMQFVSTYPTHSMHAHRHSRDDASTHDGDVHVNHDNSDSGSEVGGEESQDKSHSKKKSSKRSSRKIVVRNINYISKGRHSASSGESSDEDVDEDFLRRKVEDIVGSFEKHQHRHHHRNKTDRRNRGISNGSGEAIENNMEGEEDDVAEKSNRKKTDGWDAFQNILMKEDSDRSQVTDPERRVSYAGDKQKHMDVVDDYCASKQNDTSRSSSYDYHQLDEELAKGRKPNKGDVDPLVQNGHGTILNGGGHENFENSESYRRIIRRGQNENEEFLMSQRQNTTTHSSDNFSGTINESSTIKSHRDGDWLVIDEYGRKPYRESGDSLNLEADLIQRSKIHDSQIPKKIDHVAFDDSIVVPERSSMDQQQHSSLWEADMGIISGIGVLHSSQDTSCHTKEHIRVDSHEPDDLMMMLGRDSEVERVSRSWSPPDVDFTADFSHTISSEKNASVEQDTVVNDDKLPTVKNKANGKLTENDKKPKPIRGSLTRSRTEVLPRSKKLTNMSKEAIQLTKAKQEEANRKRLEELTIERQKRIAERSAKRSTTATCKQVKPDDKKVNQSNTREAKSVAVSTYQQKK